MISIAEDRARAKRWGAPSFLLVWVAPGGRARLTVEHLSPLAAKTLVGWQFARPGMYRKTVAWADLAAELERLGRAMAKDRTA